jgi:hypothetical protein
MTGALALWPAGAIAMETPMYGLIGKMTALTER